MYLPAQQQQRQHTTSQIRGHSEAGVGTGCALARLLAGVHWIPMGEGPPQQSCNPAFLAHLSCHTQCRDPPRPTAQEMSVACKGYRWHVTRTCQQSLAERAVGDQRDARLLTRLKHTVGLRLAVQQAVLDLQRQQAQHYVDSQQLPSPTSFWAQPHPRGAGETANFYTNELSCCCMPCSAGHGLRPAAAAPQQQRIQAPQVHVMAPSTPTWLLDRQVPLSRRTLAALATRSLLKFETPTALVKPYSKSSTATRRQPGVGKVNNKDPHFTSTGTKKQTPPSAYHSQQPHSTDCPCAWPYHWHCQHWLMCVCWPQDTACLCVGHVLRSPVALGPGPPPSPGQHSQPGPAGRRHC